MKKILIHYKDSSDQVTERTISDYRIIDDKVIEAHCHLRNSLRTFIASNIIRAVDLETGEVIENIWKLFTPKEKKRKSLSSITWSHLTAIKAIRLFAMTTLGFSKANRERERKHVITYIKMHTDTDSYTDQEIDEWLKQLWCGDYSAYRHGETAEYEALINAIPTEQKPDALTTAYAIVSGSGRKPVTPEIVERLHKDFG